MWEKTGFFTAAECIYQREKIGHGDVEDGREGEVVEEEEVEK